MGAVRLDKEPGRRVLTQQRPLGDAAPAVVTKGERAVHHEGRRQLLGWDLSVGVCAMASAAECYQAQTWNTAPLCVTC